MLRTWYTYSRTLQYVIEVFPVPPPRAPASFSGTYRCTNSLPAVHLHIRTGMTEMAGSSKSEVNLLTDLNQADGTKMTLKDSATTETKIATICATVTSGFEHLAVQECKQKLSAETQARTVKKFRGRILIDLPHTDVGKASTLRSVDNLSVLVGFIKDIDLSQEKEATIQDICQKIDAGNWALALDTWRLFTGTDFCLDSLPSSSSSPTGSADQGEEEQTNEDDQDQTPVKRPTFRVTCTRTGDKHKFNSRDVAPAVGSLVNERFGWPVQMKEYDIEVVVNILEESVMVALSLTTESMHRRNITHFGITTLKSTIAYCMLSMAQPKPGEVLCDPMCGVGAIPLEGLIDWKSCYVLAGDIHDVPVERTKANYDAYTDRRKEKKIPRPDIENDVCQWDVTNLPLKTSSIDVIVSDLPFGKRMGNRRNNWSLYLKCLEEMARVCRPGSRAVLLTHDKKCMVQTLQRCNHLWRKKNFIFINHGGLRACVYLLQRAKVKNKSKGSGGAQAGSSQDARNKDDGEEQSEQQDVDEQEDEDDAEKDKL